MPLLAETTGTETCTVLIVEYVEVLAGEETEFFMWGWVSNKGAFLSLVVMIVLLWPVVIPWLLVSAVKLFDAVRDLVESVFPS